MGGDGDDPFSINCFLGTHFRSFTPSNHVGYRVSDDCSSLDSDSHFRDDLGLKSEDEAESGTTGFDSGEPDCNDSSNEAEESENSRRRLWMNACSYRKIMRSYAHSSVRLESLNEAKRAILSYTPGSLVGKVDGLELGEFNVPRTTTMLLVGPKGSGKSSLINRISRALEDDELASDRAQVSYSSCMGDGTYFLHGYMVPRRSKSICMFDTRGLSDDLLDNFDLLKSWMTDGVQNGKLVIRDADGKSLRNILRCKIRDNHVLSPLRKVDFVIFVVSGLEAVKYMNSDDEEDMCNADTLSRTYNFPYLSIKDDKPVVVVTHGDLLSLEERVRVRLYLGKLLCVSPTTQIFDIPESSDPVAEIATFRMLTYALEHADKNLPRRSWLSQKLCPPKSSFQQVLKSFFVALIFLGFACGMSRPWLWSTLNHHRGAPVNRAIDLTHHLQFNAMSNLSSSRYEPLLPMPNNNQPAVNSAIEPPTSKCNQTTDQPHGLPVGPEPRFESHVDQPTKKKKKAEDKKRRRAKKNRSRRKEAAVETEVEMNWEARKRLHLGEGY